MGRTHLVLPTSRPDPRPRGGRHRPVGSVTMQRNRLHPDARIRPLTECRHRLRGGVVRGGAAGAGVG